MDKSYTEILKGINMELQEAIEITALDFNEVNERIKEYYHTTDSKTATNVQDGINDIVQSMITNLQHHDIFRQRVEHVVLVHQKLTEDEWQLDFVEPVFHLHVFQAITIELDLLKAISSIADALVEVQNHSAEMRRFWNTEFFFTKTSRIKEIIKKTISILQQAGGNLKQIPLSPLTVNQLKRIYSLYTIESERVVLDWFIGSIPSGSQEELLLHYQEEVNRLNIENAELF